MQTEFQHQFQLSQIADEISELITQEQLSEHFSSESVDTVSGLFAAFGNGVQKTFKKLFNIHETGSMIEPQSPHRATQALKRKDLSEYRDLKVYRVPKVESRFDVFVGVLNKQVELHSDISERLYRPLNRWAATVITDEEYNEKPWVDRKLKFHEVSKSQKDLAKHFTTQKFREEESEYGKFINVFGSVKVFEDTWSKVEDLDTMISDLNLVELKKMEQRLVTNVNRVADMIEAGEFQDMNKDSRKLLAKSFVQLAQETEYLAALIFYSNNVFAAWNETIAHVYDVHG